MNQRFVTYIFDSVVLRKLLDSKKLIVLEQSNIKQFFSSCFNFYVILYCVLRIILQIRQGRRIKWVNGKFETLTFFDLSFFKNLRQI